jgi:hypothetical protein
MSFLPVMLAGLGKLESSAYNILKETGSDFLSNVRSEFGLTKHHSSHSMTSTPKHVRHIGNNTRTHRRIK